MKRKIALLASWIINLLLPLKIEKKISNFLNYVYSYRIQGEFAKVGENFLCERSITLWGAKNIQIGDNVHIFARSILATHSTSKGSGKIKIGNNVTIGEYNHLTSASLIVIDDGVLFGRRVTITDNSHGSSSYNDMITPPLMRLICSKSCVYICKNVWVGDNVVVLPGVTIGEGSIVGAGSIVTSDIPPYSVAVGNPAKVVKECINSVNDKI